MTPEIDPAIRTLAERAVRALVEAGATLSVAESCTGGWLGASLTSIPGSSAVFWGGIIAYDDMAKVELLGVRRGTLAEHGAVSEPVAAAMAVGVAGVSGTTLGIAITGVAGPDGGTPASPVGTVYVAVAGARPRCEEFRFEGDRHAVRRQSVLSALTLVVEAVAEPDG